jgi:MoxR-like ATPase
MIQADTWNIGWGRRGANGKVLRRVELAQSKLALELHGDGRGPHGGKQQVDADIRELNARIGDESARITPILDQVHRVVVGQDQLLDRLLIGVLAGGHVLLEGVPGLAKTLAVKSLSEAVRGDFQRIQFTPDLLPADLTGTLIFNPREGTFTPRKGPIFANLILADEINRAPAKVQSALLESMQEGQVTIGDTTYPLPDPFLVLATQNPIEQEGTYPLPEAQVDRFMLKVLVTYPSRDEEKMILERMEGGQIPEVTPVVGLDDILRARKVVDSVYLDDRVKSYILNLVFATRHPDDYGLDLSQLVRFGGSPRATLFLARAAKAQAFLNGRGFVIPEDVKSIGFDVLRHRLILTYEAEAEEVTPEDVIQKVFDAVEVP